MKSHAIVALASLLCLSKLYGDAANISDGTDDGTERWGYVEVRQSNHLFTNHHLLHYNSLLFYHFYVLTTFICACYFEEAYLFWYYYKSPHQVSSPEKPWPTILWLQGGPVQIIFPSLPLTLHILNLAKFHVLVFTYWLRINYMSNCHLVLLDLSGRFRCWRW